MRRARVSPAASARLTGVKRALSWTATGGRRHALFLVLLTAGAALRAVTFFAYRPALIFADSHGYLANMADLEPKTVRPIGYAAFLRLLPVEHGLSVVPAVQHLLGLAIAVLIYVLLLRLGVRRWLAALATVPVLFDAFQLNLEQQVLTETLFELLLAAACALLLWRSPLGVAAAGVAGLLLAGAALTRAVGVLTVVPAVLTVFFLRAGLSRALALLACFAVPVAAYAVWFHSLYGVYALTGSEGRFLYARVAPFADCAELALPADERVLCPKQPVGRRPTVDQFMWSPRHSPFYRVEPRRGRSRSELAADFAKRVILHQPLTYARTVASDFLRGFAPTRTREPGEVAVGRWQFHETYPYRTAAGAAVRRHGGGRPYADPELASFLSAYRRYAYVPGPLLGAGLLVGLLASLGVGRARASGLRSASFLFSSVAFVVLLGSVAVSLFSWRYQLPQLVLLPPAAALGLTALTRKKDASPARSADARAPDPEPPEARKLALEAEDEATVQRPRT